jgi:hypothetical protein
VSLAKKETLVVRAPLFLWIVAVAVGVIELIWMFEDSWRGGASEISLSSSSSSFAE